MLSSRRSQCLIHLNTFNNLKSQYQIPKCCEQNKKNGYTRMSPDYESSQSFLDLPRSRIDNGVEAPVSSDFSGQVKTCV